MKLSLFYRLTIGYVVIFLFMAAASFYAIQVLLQFNQVAAILDQDKKISEFQGKLSDLLLSEIQFEKKFILIKDTSLRDQFVQAQEDFKNNLSELASLAGKDKGKLILEQITSRHDRYVALFSEEVDSIHKRRSYRKEDYKEKKEEMVEGIIAGLKELAAHSQLATYQGIKELGETGLEASRMDFIISMASLLFLILFTVFMTRSITRPLSALTEKTKKIAGGDFSGDLKITSPPEIKAFADAFNSMCLRLQEVEKIKSDFFSLMSHELRTPLTSIKEGTNLLLEGIGGEVSEKQKKLLSIISQESNRLIRLVNSLLDLSKMEAGMMKVVKSGTNLGQLILQAVKEIEPLRESKQITVDVNLDEQVPQIKIDRERILQGVRNLLGNAVKFTPPGGRVTVNLQAFEKGVKVAISDTGPGIPKDILPAIFEKFQQANLTQSSQIKGTGLGLAIVKHIISSHGGRIWVESELGKGSTFTFFLPF